MDCWIKSGNDEGESGQERSIKPREIMAFLGDAFDQRRLAGFRRRKRILERGAEFVRFGDARGMGPERGGHIRIVAAL